MVRVVASLRKPMKGDPASIAARVPDENAATPEAPPVMSDARRMASGNSDEAPIPARATPTHATGPEGLAATRTTPTHTSPKPPRRAAPAPARTHTPSPPTRPTHTPRTSAGEGKEEDH